MNKVIYLDNAATTFPKPEIVYKTMDNYLRNSCVNSGRGAYKLAKQSEDVIDETRELILNLINGNDKGKVYFSPSATIASNQVLNGLNWNEINNVYVSPFEHNAIMRTLKLLSSKFDFSINVLPFDNITFEIKEKELKVMFAKNKPDVIIMSHVSNVTGYILPIKQCHDLAKQYNPINIVDCAQSLGVVNIDAKKEFDKCDFVIFAGHKSLYGPLGVGGFIQLNDNIRLNTFITGGNGSESTNLEMPLGGNGRYEIGSYNTYAIVGLNAGLKWINETGRENIYNHKKELTNILIDGLKEIDEVELYVSSDLDKHIGVVAFNVEGYLASDIGRILDEEYNICVRTGHHCAPLVGKFLEGYAVDGTVRVSVGFFNNCEEINEVINNIRRILY